MDNLVHYLAIKVLNILVITMVGNVRVEIGTDAVHIFEYDDTDTDSYLRNWYPPICVLQCALLQDYALIIYRLEQQNKFSEPMPWIGIYIAVASLFCSLAMVADLLHGFRNRKFWFPCKYFTLNAAFLTVIAIAMKLPVDLNTYMPGIVDQAAKHGSMAFMCTMMANLIPSLATMNNKEHLQKS